MSQWMSGGCVSKATKMRLIAGLSILNQLNHLTFLYFYYVRITYFEVITVFTKTNYKCY